MRSTKRYQLELKVSDDKKETRNSLFETLKAAGYSVSCYRFDHLGGRGGGIKKKKFRNKKQKKEGRGKNLTTH